MNYVFALSEGKKGFKHFLLIWATAAFSFLLVISVDWVQTIYFRAKKSLYILYSSLSKPIISLSLSPADVVCQGKYKPYDLMSAIYQPVPALPTLNPFEPSVKTEKLPFVLVTRKHKTSPQQDWKLILRQQSSDISRDCRRDVIPNRTMDVAGDSKHHRLKNSSSHLADAH